jgi:hypothetical protein
MPACAHCGDPFELRTEPSLQGQRYCSKRCGAQARSAVGVTAYATIYLPEHPLAMRNGSVAAHRLALWEKIGPDDHPCHWCNRMLAWFAAPRILVDHLNAQGRDNRPDNIVPACRRCNSARTSQRIPNDELKIFAHGKWHRARTITCAHCGVPRLIRRNRAGRFCSRACASRHRVNPHGASPTT